MAQPTQRQERYATFRKQIEDGIWNGTITSDHELRDYQGRYGYDGPAIRCDSFDEIVEVARATTGKLQIDDLGRGYIVYPR